MALECGSLTGKRLGQTLDHLCDQFIPLSNSLFRVIHEALLNDAPAGAEIPCDVFVEKRCKPLGLSLRRPTRVGALVLPQCGAFFSLTLMPVC